MLNVLFRSSRARNSSKKKKKIERRYKKEKKSICTYTYIDIHTYVRIHTHIRKKKNKRKRRNNSWNNNNNNNIRYPGKRHAFSLFNTEARILAWQLKCFWLRTEMIRDDRADDPQILVLASPNQSHFNSPAIRSLPLSPSSSPQACYHHFFFFFFSFFFFFFFFFLVQAHFSMHRCIEF